MRSWHLWVLVLAALALLGGCGGDGGEERLAADDYRKRVMDLDMQAFSADAALERADSSGEIRVALTRVRDAYRTYAAELAQLAPPEKVENTHRTLLKAVRALAEETKATLRRRQFPGPGAAYSPTTRESPPASQYELSYHRLLREAR